MDREPELHVYRIHWTEGDPIIVESSGFGSAVNAFVAWAREDDDSVTEEQATDWISAVEKLTDNRIIRDPVIT